MKKTRNVKPTVPELLNEVIKKSDIVLCILDARFIEETRNLYLESMIKSLNKKIIYIFNKADIAPKIDKKVLEELSPNVIVSCTTRKGASDLRQGIRIIADRLNKIPVYVGVIGYPNTGKSSVINLILGRKEVAKTSAVSGYTRGIHLIKLSSDIYLVDSPGIIPQTEIDKDIIKLAKIGVITFDMAKDPSLIVYELMNEYPEIFEKFYGIDANGDSELLIETLARKNNMLLRKGELDTERAARMVIKDWQKGNIIAHKTNHT